MPGPKRKRARNPVLALAAEIRGLRVRLGLSQGQFARECGVSQQTVSDWEQGKRLRRIKIAARLLKMRRGQFEYRLKKHMSAPDQ